MHIAWVGFTDRPAPTCNKFWYFTLSCKSHRLSGTQTTTFWLCSNFPYSVGSCSWWARTHATAETITLIGSGLSTQKHLPVFARVLLLSVNMSLVVDNWWAFLRNFHQFRINFKGKLRHHLQQLLAGMDKRVDHSCNRKAECFHRSLVIVHTGRGCGMHLPHSKNRQPHRSQCNGDAR